MVPLRYICQAHALRASFRTRRNTTTVPFPPMVGLHRTTATREVHRMMPRRTTRTTPSFTASVARIKIPHTVRTHYFSSSSSTSSTSSGMSEDELQRRLEIFKDLYVVARDCMEDLVSTQEEEADEEEDDSDETVDKFLKNVAFVQEAVLAAQKEYHAIINDLNDNAEQRGRVDRSHGVKLKRLEMELRMLLLNTNIDGDNNNNNGDGDDDGDDDDDDLDDDEDDDVHNDQRK